MNEEKKDAIDLTLSYASDELQKMKSTLESYYQREMSNEEVVNRLTYWACKSIASNMHSIELQIKLKP